MVDGEDSGRAKTRVNHSPKLFYCLGSKKSGNLTFIVNLDNANVFQYNLNIILSLSLFISQNICVYIGGDDQKVIRLML